MKRKGKEIEAHFRKKQVFEFTQNNNFYISPFLPPGTSDSPSIPPSFSLGQPNRACSHSRGGGRDHEV